MCSENQRDQDHFYIETDHNLVMRSLWFILKLHRCVSVHSECSLKVRNSNPRKAHKKVLKVSLRRVMRPPDGPFLSSEWVRSLTRSLDRWVTAGWVNLLLRPIQQDLITLQRVSLNGCTEVWHGHELWETGATQKHNVFTHGGRSLK